MSTVSRKGYTIYRRGGKGPWYVAWVDGTGTRRVQRASASKSVAQEVGRAKAAEADRVRTGVIDGEGAKVAQAGREPVARHLEAWRKSLKAKGNTARHVTHHHRRAEVLLERATASTLADVAGERVQLALEAIGKQFTPQTARHYLTALRGFIKWCLKTDRLAVDPLRAVDRPNVAGDSFTRRPLSDDDLAKILEAAATRPCKASTLPGPTRAMYYRVMAYTGLRVSEALSLTPASFDLSVQPGRVTVEAAYSKHRRRDQLLIRDDFADLLRPWLAGRPGDERLFPFGPTANLHRLFARDAKAAGIVAASDREVVGMHSLRRFYITRAVRAGGLAVAQDLARHSTPALTKKYADLEQSDHLAGLAGLPAVVSAPDSATVPEGAGIKRKGGA